MEQTNLDRFYLLAFTTLGLVLRLLYVSQSEIAFDEPYSIGVAQLPFANMWEYLRTSNNPPLFELLLHGVVKLWGIEPPWVRLISAVASAITVVFVYLIGSRFFTRRIAVSASLLYTFSTFQISFSHEASVYALFNLFTCASVFLILTLHKQERMKWHTVIAFVLVNILLVYSHYFGWVVWALELSWLLAIGQTQKQSWPLWLALLLVVPAYIPQLEIVWSRLSDVSQAQEAESPALVDLYYNMMKMMNAPVVAFIAISIGGIAAVKAIIAKHYQRIPDHTLLILHWFVTAYFGLFLVSMVVPVFVDRSLIFVSGALYLCLAIAIDSLLPEERSWPLHGLMGILFMLSVNLKPDHGRRWEGLVEHVSAQQTPQSCVVLIPKRTQLPYTYHLNRAWFADFKNIPATLNQHHCYAINNLEDLQKLGLDTLFDHLILVDAGSQFTDKNRLVLKYLKKTYTRSVLQKPFNGVVVLTFQK